MKIKLKLDELKIQSFITELKSQVAHTAKGGNDDGVDVSTSGSSCDTNHCIPPTTSPPSLPAISTTIHH
jgi:hypothetical protein